MLFWDQLWEWCLVRERDAKQETQCIFPNLRSCQRAGVYGLLNRFAGLALAAPFGDIYFGLWGYNCVLACIAIGGMFYGLTWQVHLLALTCGKWMQSPESNLVQLDQLSGNLTND